MKAPIDGGQSDYKTNLFKVPTQHSFHETFDPTHRYDVKPLNNSTTNSLWQSDQRHQQETKRELQRNSKGLTTNRCISAQR